MDCQPFRTNLHVKPRVSGRFLIYRVPNPSRTACPAVSEDVRAPKPGYENRWSATLFGKQQQSKWEGALVAEGSGPRFYRPCFDEEEDHSSEDGLPIMIFLPGVDGTGMTASRQYPSLGKSFDLFALVIPPTDRTTFKGLVEYVKGYIKGVILPDAGNRPIYIAGDSFGALIALSVAHDCKDIVDRVLLVNPATSLEGSFFSFLYTLLPNLPAESKPYIPLLLAPALGNPLQMLLRGIDLRASPTIVVSQLLEGLAQLTGTLGFMGDSLKPGSFEWRLSQIQEGVKTFEDIYPKVVQRCLEIVSEGDWLFPTKQDANSLQDKMQRCTTVKLEGRSHMLLQEAGVDLSELMKEAGFYMKARQLSNQSFTNGNGRPEAGNNFGSASGPIAMPTETEFRKTDEELKAFVGSISPVFLSTLEDGSIVEGLDGVPSNKPILFVGNHQTLGFDALAIVAGLLKEKNILVRGLAHPFFSQIKSPEELEGYDLGPFGPDAATVTQATRVFTTFGAVPVSGKNMFQLLKRGEHVLLYPGGIREAYKLKGEKYQLFWPEESEFVRMAAKFGATIVPFAGIGMEDSLEILLDSNEIESIPVVNTYLRSQLDKYVPRARTGVSGDVGVEGKILTPLTVPKLPSRAYFLMKKPITLEPSKHRDKTECSSIYQKVKMELESGLQYLLEKREEDRYKDYIPRVLYEATSNGKKAPTFKP